jgi:hypothetical protein
MRSTCLVLIALLAPTARAEEQLPSAYLVSLLEKATELELFSLDPMDQNEKEGFHGYKILGKTAVKDDTRKQLVAAFKKGVQDNKGTAANCFIPRHGVRFKIDKVTVDLVICFQCFQVRQYYDDKSGPGFLITDSPQPAFNKVLKDAGVPLPKGAEK